MSPRKGLWACLALFLLGLITLAGFQAEAQTVTIEAGQEGALTERVLQLIALLTVLSLAPSIVIMTTSFVRIIVVLSLLRTGLGLQQSPPNAVLVSLAIFLTGFIMAPVFTQSYEDGIQPLLAEEIELTEAFDRSTGPLKAFMLTHVREDDLALFIDHDDTLPHVLQCQLKLTRLGLGMCLALCECLSGPVKPSLVREPEVHGGKDEDADQQPDCDIAISVHARCRVDGPLGNSHGNEQWMVSQFAP